MVKDGRDERPEFGGEARLYRIGTTRETGTIAAMHSSARALALALALALVVLIPTGLRAEPSVLPAQGIAAFSLQRPDAGFATRSVVAVSGQAFPQAVRVVTAKVPDNGWGIQLNAPTAAPVASGDILVGEVWLRRVLPDGGSAAAEIVFEQAGGAYTQSLVRAVADSSGNWTRFRFAFAARAAYPAGGAQVNLRLGFAEQTVELAGLVLENHATSQPLSAFPNDFSYAGREADAPWRALAAASIEKNRKAPISVRVLDAAGFPIPGADVEFLEVKPAFAFGSAVVASRLLGTGTDDRRYQAIVTNWFDTVVLENDLKWPAYEANPTAAQKAVDWLRARHIAVRGHNLVWPGTNSPSFLPADVPKLFSDATKLRARIDAHLTNVAGKFAGKLADWDVVNEPLHEKAIEGILGRQEIADWISIAHAVDPASTPFVNEYENLESIGTAGTTRLRAFADDLRGRGAPLGALGLQSHFSGYLTPPPEITRRLDLLAGIQPAATSFALRVTEFDVDTADESLQADFTRDFMTAAFAHPATTGFLSWGFWESQHWLPKAAMFRANWEPKPSALVCSNLTQRAWITRTNVSTSISGQASVRGFKGDYRIRVRANGITNDFLATVLADTVVDATMPVVPPTISVEPGAAGFHFSWAGQASGYTLESTELLVPADWQPVEVIPMLRKDRLSLDLPPGETTRYFRLHRPATPP